MKCNKCWHEFEPKAKGVASSCGHLYCLPCAEDLLGSTEGGSCPLCEALITKSSVKLINVLQDPRACQLSLCGQEPETALSSALASVKFYLQQKELDASLTHSKLAAKVERVQEACKRKLQEVHNGYLTAKRKYQEVLEVKNALEADNEELKLKYQSKAQQTRKHVELSKKLQETCERLQRDNMRLQQENDSLRGAGPRHLVHATPARQNPAGFSRHFSPRPDHVVTTVHQKQVMLGPGNQNLSGSTGFGSGGRGGQQFCSSARLDTDLGNLQRGRVEGQGRENLNLGNGMALGVGGNAGLCTPNFRAGAGPGGQRHARPQRESNGFLSGFPRSPSGFR